MASNYPAGVTDVTIDDYFGPDEPEPTDEELDAMYLDRVEQEAAALPAEWTEEDIVQYEVWLASRGGEIPRLAPISVAVQLPQELEAA